MVNWNKLAKQIPHKVQVGNKKFYEVTWVDRFDDAGQLGEMHKEKKLIKIKIDQSDREKVLTYLHEVFHAFSDEHEIGLTESQVGLLEKKMFYYFLKPQNLFTKE